MLESLAAKWGKSAVAGDFAVKLPWRRKEVGSGSPGLAEAVSALTTGDGPDARGQATARGDEILENSNVETAELGALAKLPPFRPVAISLMRLFDCPDVKTDEITKLVESDPSLTSELLAVVNSPLFAFRTTVASPEHAITLLGVERTKSLAATLAMRSMMQGGPRTPVVRRFWVHSIATATIAQHFAVFLRVDPQRAYVGALLHDLGRLGLLAAHPEEYAALALASHESTEDILAAEKTAFGMTHCHAGALLAKAWSLPEPLGIIARHHHDPSSDQDVVSLIQLSCRLADDSMYQAILRRDIRKPEETIETYAPTHVREQLINELETVSGAVIDSIQKLDF